MVTSFLYCWTDSLTRKLYIGKHRGSPSDGYVCSSKSMLNEYVERPHHFSRQIIAVGLDEDISALERTVLVSSKAHINPSFYNLALPNGVCMSTPEIRAAQSRAAKNRPSNRVGTSQTARCRSLVQLNNPRRRVISTPRGRFLSAEDFEKKLGILTAHTVRKLCGGVTITQHQIRRNPLLTTVDLGKCSNDLGWNFTDGS